MTSIWRNGLLAFTPDNRILILREETETHDREHIDLLVEKYFERTYPEFIPDVVSTMDKDYFLPALKVLDRRKDGLYSPYYPEKWNDMELKAECHRNSASYMSSHSNRIIGQSFGMSFDDDSLKDHPHESPDDECDCGIYGSVNLEELKQWLEPEEDNSLVGAFTIPTFTIPNGILSASYGYPVTSETPENHEKILCIIEPSEDAKVILCRKGWRASSAFISEIVNETMGMSDASRLLSMTWHRIVDVGRIYENRKKD